MIESEIDPVHQLRRRVEERRKQAQSFRNVYCALFGIMISMIITTGDSFTPLEFVLGIGCLALMIVIGLWHGIWYVVITSADQVLAIDIPRVQNHEGVLALLENWENLGTRTREHVWSYVWTEIQHPETWDHELDLALERGLCSILRHHVTPWGYDLVVVRAILNILKDHGKNYSLLAVSTGIVDLVACFNPALKRELEDCAKAIEARPQQSLPSDRSMLLRAAPAPEANSILLRPATNAQDASENHLLQACDTETGGE